MYRYFNGSMRYLNLVTGNVHRLTTKADNQLLNTAIPALFPIDLDPEFFIDDYPVIGTLKLDIPNKSWINPRYGNAYIPDEYWEEAYANWMLQQLEQ